MVQLNFESTFLMKILQVLLNYSIDILATFNAKLWYLDRRPR